MSIIAIEGGDAVGKYTQTNLLYAEVLKKYREDECKLFRFPNYESITGKAILALLKEEWDTTDPTVRALVLQSLQTTNRYEMAWDLIGYRWSKLRHAILDRYWASGVVYGEADGLDFDYLVELHRCLPAADLWILIDLPAEMSSVRRPERRDEYERRDGFMHKVRDNYLKLFRARSAMFAGEWHIVDGTKSEADIHNDIMKLVNKYI